MSFFKSFKLPALALLCATATTGRGAVLFFEDFESLPLGPYVSPTESGGDGTDWTATPPAGWVTDLGSTPVGSPAEFLGWTFHDRQSWINTEGDQDRSAWLGGAGTVMLVDPDAYDDGTEIDESLFNVRISTPAIPLNGVVPGSVIVSFDSSFRSEPPEIASLEVTFDGINYTTLLTYDGNILVDGALYNDPISLPVNNGSSGTMQFRFNMLNASNDWWWAVDNISVTGDMVPEPSSAVFALVALFAAFGRRRRVN